MRLLFFVPAASGPVTAGAVTAAAAGTAPAGGPESQTDADRHQCQQQPIEGAHYSSPAMA